MFFASVMFAGKDRRVTMAIAGSGRIPIGILLVVAAVQTRISVVMVCDGR
jgi:hypothetical protein